MPYRGNKITIPLGADGLTGSQSLTRLAPSQLIAATNLSYENDVLQKEGGAVKYNSAAITNTPSILGGWDWWPTLTVQRMIVYTDLGTILRDTGDGTFGTTLATGLDTAAVPVFVEGGKEAAANNRKLFCFNGTDAPQVLSGDGITMAALATPPVDWSGANQPLVGVIHEGRLWAGGNANDPYRLYYSTPGNHEDFTGAGSGSISLYPGEGERLIAAVPYKGLLLAFKYPFGVYAVDTTDPTVANWRADRLTNAIGMASPRGFAVIGDDDSIIWIDQVGHIHIVAGVQEFGSVRSTNISRRLNLDPFIREQFNLVRITAAQAIYYDPKEEFHLCLSASTTTVNNRRLVIDFNGPAPRFQLSERDVNEGIWLRKDADNIQRLVIGDDAGFVWELDQDARNKDGVAYRSSFRTTNTDFGTIEPDLADRVKNGAFLELIPDVTSVASTVTLNTYWDAVFSETLTFQVPANGIALGSFTLDTDVLGPSFALVALRKRLRGGGRRFSFEILNDRLDEDFKISGVRIYFTLGSEGA